jgi:hypothetical protein
MISYCKYLWLEKLRFKLIRFLGGIPTTPYGNYPHRDKLQTSIH